MKFLRTELLEEEMIPDIYPGTCDWVFQSSQWKGRDSSPKSLCIIGPSGMGKTVLVKYLASELRRAAEKKNETATRRQAGAQLTDASLSFMEMAEFQSKAHVLSYYFDARVLSRASGVTLVKSMLHQMLTTDRNLFRHVYGRPMFSNHEAIFKGFAEVLEVMIGDPAVTTVEIIIDGLDECSESAIGEVDNLMSRLVEISSVKLITTCKSSVKDKFRSLSSVSQLDIAHDSKLKAKEMEKFILSGADKLACERKLPPDLRQDIQRHLLDQSQGNFLWVRLVLYHLGCQKTISSTRKALAMLPVKVDFEFIFSTLLNSVSDFDQSTLIRALYFVINAKTPLSIEALGSLLALARMEDKAIPSLTDIQENLILDLDLDLRRFQPLLHVIDGKVTLVHNIVRQFLSTERNISRFCDTFEAHKMHEGSAHQSIPTMRHVNAIMAELCLKYLLAECKASNTLVGDAFGLLYYASVHWAEHVCEAGDVFSEHLATPVKALLMTALRDSWIAYYRSLDSLRQRLVPSDSNPAFILSTLDICGDLVRHIQLPVNAFWKTDEDGRLPLHFAAANNSLNSIEWILKLPRLPDSSFDRMIDKEDNRGLTPLVIAIKYGNLDATRVLLGNFEKADVLRQRLGEIAAENGHRDIFLLLWEAGSIPHSTPAERLSALRQAMILNCTAVVRNLIGSLEVSDATKKTSKDRSLLHWAVAERNVDIVKILIPYIGVNVVDSKGTSPLHIAAENGDDDIVKALLRKGARSNITNKEGQSPLHLASQKGYPVVVSELLKNEASVKLASVKLVDNKGRLATHYAASIGQDQILRLLLRAGSNVLAGDADGNTILHLAAEAGHEGTVIMALSHSADVNARNSDGKTPLHRAAMSGNMDIIWLLVYHGSDPNCVDNSGVTPLHTASQLGYDIIVAELLKFGGEPNRADNRGRTPLHYVCDSKSPSDEVLKCLIDSGARIDVLDNDGNTPRAAAMAQRNFAVVAWLDRERTKFGPRLITA
jgi:ankyrin repeat protein